MKNVKAVVVLIILASAAAGAIVACVCKEEVDADYVKLGSIHYDRSAAAGVIIKVCLEGHSYYRWLGGGHQSGIAPVLQDDGTPVQCWLEPDGIIKQVNYVKAEQP